MDEPIDTYEGRDVIETGISIRKAGDGLSEAMHTEPRVLTIGEKIYVVLECVVVAVDFPAEDRKDPNRGGVKRVHVLDAGTATFVDEEVVGGMIRDQYDRNLRAREEAEGVQRLKPVGGIASG